MIMKQFPSFLLNPLPVFQCSHLSPLECPMVAVVDNPCCPCPPLLGPINYSPPLSLFLCHSTAELTFLAERPRRRARARTIRCGFLSLVFVSGRSPMGLISRNGARTSLRTSFGADLALSRVPVSRTGISARFPRPFWSFLSQTLSLSHTHTHTHTHRASSYLSLS